MKRHFNKITRQLQYGVHTEYDRIEIGIQCNYWIAQHKKNLFSSVVSEWDGVEIGI